MFGMFKKSPLKAWQKKFEALQTQAFQAQRNGNIRLYSTLTAEAETVKEKIESFKSSDDSDG